MYGFPSPSQVRHSLQVLKLIGFPNTVSVGMAACNLPEVLKTNSSPEEVAATDAASDLLPYPFSTRFSVADHCASLQTRY